MGQDSVRKCTVAFAKERDDSTQSEDCKSGTKARIAGEGETSLSLL